MDVQREFDIVFIQKLPWSIICSVSSSSNKEEEDLVGISNHSNWITFSRNTSNTHDAPRIITYINIRLSSFYFSLQKDIFNHRDISCVFFFNQGSIYYLLNIYSDSSQTALKYFKDIETNINNIFIMTSNFNIRDSTWDPLFSYHSIYGDTLTDIRLF